MDFLCEHVVDRKKEGLYKYRKAAIIAGWVIAPIIILVLCMGLSSLNEYTLMLRWVFWFVPVLFVILGGKLGPATAAYGDESYEYSIASCEMSFAKIYGNRFRRDWFTVKLSELEKCAPLTDQAYREISNQSFDRVYKAISSYDAPYIYYAIFKNSNDERCIVYFEVIKKSLKMIKTYFPSTVMTNIEI